MQEHKIVYSPYTKKELEKYQYQLINILSKSGITCEMINNNAYYKNFIANYVESEIVNKIHKFALQDITHKFIHMNISMVKNNKNTEYIYPVINRYKGHNLLESILYVIDSNEVITTRTVPFRDSSIILLN